MMESDTIVLNRKDLYEKVWKEPMSRIAPQYGISDVGLKKICRKLDIPTPPRGYWVRLQFGQKVERTPLPKLKEGTPSIYELQGGQIDEKVQTFWTEVTEIIAKEKALATGIKIPKILSSPHPLIRETKGVLSKAKQDDFGVLRPWRKRYLDIRVSPENLNRALRIMQALIKAFESRGFPVSIKNNGDGYPSTYIKIFGEEIKFALKEKVSRSEHVPTEKEQQEKRKHGFLYDIQRWDFTPTGKFTLLIDDWGNGQRKQWSDGRTQTVEGLLHSFLIGVVKYADVERQERELREEEQQQWEEERRLRAELERRRRAEEERLQDLEHQTLQWAKSQQLRAYIKEVEKVASRRPKPNEFQSDLDLWLNWAKLHADRLDPLTRGLPFENRQVESGELKENNNG